MQEESFRRHIDLAKHLDKTLVIHDRDAHADILRIMDDEGAPRRVVMHCFSGDAAFAEAVTQRGWFCSFAGVVTFKNAGSLREALAVVPATAYWWRPTPRSWRPCRIAANRMPPT